MAWADGILYQSTWRGIKAVPQDGGNATTISEGLGSGSQMWVQGDRLLLAFGERLMQVPRTGGALETLLDGGGENDPRGTYDSVSQHHLFDGAYFYWSTEHTSYSRSGDATYIWRMPLAGGPVENVGMAPVPRIEGMALVPEGVLVVGAYSEVGDSKTKSGGLVVPLAGGPIRALDNAPDMAKEYSRFVSLDSGGVLSYRIVERNARKATLPIELAPVDGSPRRQLSRDLPRTFIFPKQSYPDGQGGRFILGEEEFDDHATHDTIYFVEASGRARRIACEPTGDVDYANALALSPDALYMVVDLPDSQWQIVRVPRPASQP
jgi:hypothetical protein